MSSICVIGGAGFLGAQVCRSLILAGHEITVLDQTHRPDFEGAKRFVLGDVRDSESVYEAVAGCDVVYHLAAIADILDCLEQPILSADVNIMGTLQALDACRAHNVNRFIFASSVYTQSREGGFYRCSKLACEAYIKEYHRRLDLITQYCVMDQFMGLVLGLKMGFIKLSWRR